MFIYILNRSMIIKKNQVKLNIIDYKWESGNHPDLICGNDCHVVIPRHRKMSIFISGYYYRNGWPRLIRLKSINHVLKQVKCLAKL